LPREGLEPSTSRLPRTPYPIIGSMKEPQNS
jgi:hypothetical protein